MIAMIFEFWMNPDDTDVFNEYSTTSAGLRAILAEVDGFGGVERFESCTEPGKLVAIGFFDDEAAVTKWRNTPHIVMPRNSDATATSQTIGCGWPN